MCVFSLYLPPDGEDEALFHILPDDGDKEDFDISECFAAMEQYCKNFSTLDSSSPFARHLESKVVTFKRLMNFKRPILVEFLQYLDLDDVDGVTIKILSLQIHRNDGFMEILYFVWVVGWSIDKIYFHNFKIYV